MAKIFLIERKTSKSTKYLKSDPSTGRFLWTEDPNEAYRFDEQDTAEEWMEDDSVGGTSVVRRSVAIAAYGDGADEEAPVEIKVKPKKKAAPALEDLQPIARGKTAKRQAVKVKDDEAEAPVAAPKKVAKKAAPAPAKTAAPAKKAAKTATPAKKAAKTAASTKAPTVSGETKLTAMRLPITLVDKFASLGGGNVSAGVRKMAEEYFARKK